jgi:hypothetical protein
MRPSALLTTFFLLSSAFPGFAQSPYRHIDPAKGDTYFGYLSRCDLEERGELPQVLREGAGAELAEVNFPIAPGDTLRTGSRTRCEIQFDTGGILRVDRETEVTLETVLARSLSSSQKLTNLILLEGRIHLNHRRQSRSEVFQVLTPNSAVKLDDRTMATVGLRPDGASEIRVERGRAEILYGAELDESESQKVGPGGQLVVSVEHRIEPAAATSPASGFAEWNRALDARFEVIGNRCGSIPRSILRYSPAVARFAESYSRAYGEWVWSPVYGDAWRPYDNEVAPIRETIPLGRELSEDVSTALPERARFPGQRANFLAETAAPARPVKPSPAETAVVASEASNRQGEPSPPVIALPSGERSTPRFRDWNPDVRAAHRLGATLTYSSATNEVRCPELAAAVRERLGGWNGTGGSWSGSGPGGSRASGGSGGGHGAGTPAGNRDGGGSRADRAK